MQIPAGSKKSASIFLSRYPAGKQADFFFADRVVSKHYPYLPDPL